MRVVYFALRHVTALIICKTDLYRWRGGLSKVLLCPVILIYIGAIDANDIVCRLIIVRGRRRAEGLRRLQRVSCSAR